MARCADMTAAPMRATTSGAVNCRSHAPDRREGCAGDHARLADLDAASPEPHACRTPISRRCDPARDRLREWRSWPCQLRPWSPSAATFGPPDLALRTHFRRTKCGERSELPRGLRY